MAKKKNFTYGELWMDDCAPEGRLGRGVSRVDADELTTNEAFSRWIKNNGYQVYLDYEMSGLAYTAPNEKRIHLNGNYKPDVVEAFLKHELGHLMLFDVNLFTTIKPNTLRSVICKEIYTPENVVDYGMEQLFYAENIIQDIIIETVSNGKCVCATLLQEVGANGGVKHLTELESASLIAKEVCSNILVKKEKWQSHKSDPSLLKELLESLLEELKEDTKDIQSEMEKTKKSSTIENDLNYKVKNKINKKTRIKERLEERAKKVEDSSKIDEMIEKLKEELDELQEELSEVPEKAKQAKQRALDSLNEKIEDNNTLQEKLEEALNELKNDSDAPSRSESGGGDSEESSTDAGQSSDNSNNGEANSGKGGGDAGENSRSGEGGSNSSGTPDGDSNGNTPPTGEISSNLTDHKISENSTGTGGHSFDCGLPMRKTVDREKSADINPLTTINSTVKSRKRVIELDNDGLDARGRNSKTFERESTYFKSNKKEFNETDMLKGKRKMYSSGVNVLVGLDVSGSMSSEWTSMFKKISAFLEELTIELDIDRIVYFTYNTKVKEVAENIGELRLVAGGGNAFAYVYQNLIEVAPLKEKNEIILITDCGDNLGFPLNSVCEVSCDGAQVENHISVIDTNSWGFYDKNGFDETDWSLHSMKDSKVFEEVKGNIERLIEG